MLNNVLADDDGIRKLYFDSSNMTVHPTIGMGLNQMSSLAGKGLHITADDRSLPSWPGAVWS